MTLIMWFFGDKIILYYHFQIIFSFAFLIISFFILYSQLHTLHSLPFPRHNFLGIVIHFPKPTPFIQFFPVLQQFFATVTFYSLLHKPRLICMLLNTSEMSFTQSAMRNVCMWCHCFLMGCGHRIGNSLKTHSTFTPPPTTKPLKIPNPPTETQADVFSPQTRP